MRKPWILACVLLLVSVACFAQSPSPTPLSSQALQAILGPSADGSCGTTPSVVTVAAKRPRTGLEKGACTATANCDTGPISCSGASTCSATDRSCPTTRGSVTCDGVTTFCANACPASSYCNQCDLTGDCFACCKCAGGSRCALQCADP